MTLPDLGASLPEVVVRTLVVYAFLVVVLRVAGKREVGQLSILELIVLLVVSDAVQNSMVGDNTSLWGGIVAVSTLLVADWTLRLITDRSKSVKRLVEGEPRLLIREGRLFERAMAEEGIDMDELRTALREHGIRRPSEVQLAVLETDGTISVVPRVGLGAQRTNVPPGTNRPLE
jgi:uncharacterized membrane protein YcaP (DUF421 family)